MKKFLFTVCLSCLALSAANAQASNIKLHGDLVQKPIRGMTTPIEAYQDAENVQLVFLTDLGNLVVKVVRQKTGATVYLNTVDALQGSALEINTHKWKKGVYTLTITDEDGGFLEGEFFIM